jgi:hypothetical protein
VTRSIPASALADMQGEETDGIALVFLTVEHPELGAPTRIVSDGEAFTLDGHTWTAFPFQITLLTDADRPPEARLAIQNVDRRLSRLVRQIIDPPKLKIEVIWSDQFDLTVTPRTEIGTAARIYSAEQCYLTDIEATAEELTGTIRSWDYAQELWPGLMATESRLPGLFR